MNRSLSQEWTMDRLLTNPAEALSQLNSARQDADRRLHILLKAKNNECDRLMDQLFNDALRIQNCILEMRGALR